MHTSDSGQPQRRATRFGDGFDVESARQWAYEHRRVTIGVALTALLLLAIGFVALRPAAARSPVEQSLPRATRASVSAPVPVVVAHVSGSVDQPGVYSLPPRSRVADLVEAAGGFEPAADPDRVNLASMVRDGDQVHIPAVDEETPTSDDAAGRLVDVNRADASALQTLPGIGPSLAAAIVEHRTRHGPFSSIDALSAVSGIGNATIARLRDFAEA